MRKNLLSASVLGALISVAVAAEPQKKWEASGFKNPESAVYDRARADA